MSPAMLLMIGVLLVLAFGGIAFAFSGADTNKAAKRLGVAAKSGGSAGPLKAPADGNQLRRKNMQASLKERELRHAKKKIRPTLRRRIEQAGLSITPKTYWIAAGLSGLVGTVVALVMIHSIYGASLAGFAFAFGLPRWFLSFRKKRREKAFTREFAPAIDAIVRSIKSGLPVNEALKLVGSEMADPVGGEFRLLTDSLKLGVTIDEGLKRMFERMPTAEVNFFGIVMAIQQKAGGNLSEALANLSGVLRDRKRLVNKIRAMSSEAKSSAMIIGSMPPAVMLLVYFSTPDYIALLFKTELGNLMLMGCGVWMGLGILVMKKLIAIKY